MSFGKHTPEVFLARSDSKNPATTCKGLTSTGRPCRRALAGSSTTSPLYSPAQDTDGVIAVLDEGEAAAFFCWQHKDQAEHLVSMLEERSKILSLKQKSSIDTLIERVGVLDLNEPVHAETKSAYRDHDKDGNFPTRKRRDILPHQWQNMPGPLMSVPEEVITNGLRTKPTQKYRNENSRDKRYQTIRARPSNTRASWSCCVIGDDDDYSPAPRKRQQHHRMSTGIHVKAKHESNSRNDAQLTRIPITSRSVNPKTSHMPVMQQQGSTLSRTTMQASVPHMPATPVRQYLGLKHSSTSPPNSQTASFLSLIPPHLDPATTSALLTELSKPISKADEEGYIYIFWLTPETEMTRPDEEVASSLLDPDDYSPSSSPRHVSQPYNVNADRQARQRLTAQALRRYASVRQSPADPGKILLKIGRASNVHRRLSQWTKQCGQNITLIRYYPYQRQILTPNPIRVDSDAKLMVTHVHRVERLIHIELADKRVKDKDKCETCGKTHKEWFEVDATKKGLQDIDETVKRWVGWAQGLRPDDLV